VKRVPGDDDVKKMLREIRESLERSQQLLATLSQQTSTGSPSAPPPPSPPSPASPSAPASEGKEDLTPYRRRITATYDASFFSGEDAPAQSGERLQVKSNPTEPPRSLTPGGQKVDGTYAILNPRPRKRR
jgi:hypothetical protein